MSISSTGSTVITDVVGNTVSSSIASNHVNLQRVANDCGVPSHTIPVDALTTEALLVLIGQRVRLRRDGRKLSRKRLSELSGISVRYLAQLESGKGNISLGLLQRVTNALQFPMNELLANVDHSDSSSNAG